MNADTTMSCVSFIHAKIFKLLFILNFLCFFVHPLSFSIPRFNPNTLNIDYSGDGKAVSGNAQLTSFSGKNLVGWCTYAQPFLLFDPSTSSQASFETHFSFSIEIGKSNPSFSDGFAFFLAPLDYSIPQGSAGAYLGLFNRNTCFDQRFNNKVVVVEFDTYHDRWDPDHSKPHVGINVNQITSRVASRWKFSSSESEKVVRAMITYNATMKVLQVFWAYKEDLKNFDHDGVTSNTSSFNSLSYRIDLTKILPNKVKVGFSGATGTHVEKHLIHSWSFVSTHNKINKPKKGNKLFFVALLAPMVSFTLMLGFAFWYYKKRKPSSGVQGLNHDQRQSMISVNKDLEKRAFPRQFSRRELVEATKCFAEEARLGKGGSGKVYRGVIQDLGCEVAVKRITSNSGMYEKIFINEVQIISRIIHRNVVQFIGWCYEQNECLIVYAYMPNGSLDTHLFGSRKPTLPWHTRYKIALGLATALHYLHEEAEQCILHRDIKSANVLLDNDFNTKLGDFGIAKSMDSQLNTDIKGMAGTMGYMAPENAIHGRVSKESDMFSFGVVALEIACGRRTYRNGKYHLPLFGWVWQAYLAGKLLDVADRKLAMDYDKKEMECLLIVGLWCTNPNDQERPKASQVMKMLQLETPLPQLSDEMHGLPLLQDLHQLAGLLDSHVSLTSSLNSVGR